MRVPPGSCMTGVNSWGVSAQRSEQVTPPLAHGHAQGWPRAVPRAARHGGRGPAGGPHAVVRNPRREARVDRLLPLGLRRGALRAGWFGLGGVAWANAAARNADAATQGG